MSVVPAPGPLPVVGDGDADDWPIIGVLKESGDPSLPCGGSSGPIAGMNRASRGSGAWQRRRQSLGWRLGKPGLACAQACG
jgi:hypothetical protein